MSTNKALKLLWVAAAVVAGGLGGCRCGRDVSVDDGAQIDRTALAQGQPGADQPETSFPSRWQQDDATVNKFIHDALSVCAEGDYDRFRELFGTDHSPPSEGDFERVWHNVRAITVAGVHRDPRQESPAQYYLHFAVRLREADQKNRQRRDVVVKLFQEAGQWRMGQAEREIVGKVLAASTRPAGIAPSGSTRPAGIAPAGNVSP